MIALILTNGLGFFWPGDLVQLTLADGTVLLGEVAAREANPAARARRSISEALRDPAEARQPRPDWRRLPLGRRRRDRGARTSRPTSLYVERREYGPFIGRVVADQGRRSARSRPARRPCWRRCRGWSRRPPPIARRSARIERDELGAVNYRIEQARLDAAAARARSAGERHRHARGRDARRLEHGPRRCRRSTPGSKRGSSRSSRRHPGTAWSLSGRGRRREGTAGPRPLSRLSRQPAVDVGSALASTRAGCGSS